LTLDLYIFGPWTFYFGPIDTLIFLDTN